MDPRRGCTLAALNMRSPEGPVPAPHEGPGILLDDERATAALERMDPRQIDGRGYLADFRPGETVSIHWNWACDRLEGPALGQLVRATRRAIAHTNMTL